MHIHAGGELQERRASFRTKPAELLGTGIRRCRKTNFATSRSRTNGRIRHYRRNPTSIRLHLVMFGSFLSVQNRSAARYCGGVSFTPCRWGAFHAKAPVGQALTHLAAAFCRASARDLLSGAATRMSKPRPANVSPNRSPAARATSMHRPQSMHFPGSNTTSGWSVYRSKRLLCPAKRRG